MWNGNCFLIVNNVAALKGIRIVYPYDGEQSAALHEKSGEPQPGLAEAEAWLAPVTGCRCFQSVLSYQNRAFYLALVPSTWGLPTDTLFFSTTEFLGKLL